VSASVGVDRDVRDAKYDTKKKKNKNKKPRLARAARVPQWVVHDVVFTAKLG
jgi:hypothetical protein